LKFIAFQLLSNVSLGKPRETEPGKLNGKPHLVIYADDANLLTPKYKCHERKAETQTNNSKAVGLQVKGKKTIYIVEGIQDRSITQK
jgi:hypothetical protein